MITNQGYNIFRKALPALVVILFGVFNTSLAQDYDKEILRLIDKLEIYPAKTRYMEQLRTNLDAANNRDMTEINELRAAGQPDRWYGIYILMNRITLRQNAVKTLPASGDTPW